MLITTSVLVVLAALIGFRVGLNWEPVTETHVIERIAKEYVRETGGQPSDCLARPGQGAEWLIVVCGAKTYRIGADGRELPDMGPSI